jgi:hypothetical protein
MARKKTKGRAEKQLSDAFNKNKGALHRELGVPLDEPIPMEKLVRAARSKNLKTKRRALAALNMMRSSGKAK